jgi:hypothetical protein
MPGKGQPIALIRPTMILYQGSVTSAYFIALLLASSLINIIG